MFSKLALSNVKKSLKDYTIYFLTLTFGVCLFYVFNSIESQKSMMMLSESQYEIMAMLTQVISGVSVFVSVILGFLIIYANKFLIKRRKKELGIYMTLGMEKGKISKILVIETFIISIFSLGVGLIIGLFVSQGLSVVTAKLFEVDLSNFHFIFSTSAFIKSIIYFGIIFIIVMIFNVFIISKCKLIDLLYAHKKNEKMKLKKLWVSVGLFIISIACLGFAYSFIIHNGMKQIDFEFWMAIALGTIGTILFFMSLSGFLLKVVQGNKRFYFKGLNMFVLRQLNSKINTTFVSMALICIMLLLTIGTLSSGMGLANAMTKGLGKITPFDASVFVDIPDNEKGNIAASNLKLSEIMGSDLNNLAKEYVEVSEYQLPMTYKKLLTNIESAGLSSTYVQLITSSKVMGIKLSDYNKLLKIQGIEPISLKENEYALNCSYESIMTYYNISDIKALEISGESYSLYKNAFQETQLQTSNVTNDFGLIILPDEAIKNFSLGAKIININYKEANKASDEKLKKLVDSCTINIDKEVGFVTNYATKQEIYETSVGVKVMVSYIAIYIGIVFLITCVAVLALQQLSESSDNIERYKLLREIGTEEKMINNALFWQVLIYFMMPLSLSIVHSVVGISVANRLVKMVGHLDILSSTISTALIILVIYGGYFIATYLSCKNMIKSKK